MPASEIAAAERESESKSPERAAAAPALQTAPGMGEPRLAGGSADSTARLVSNVALRHPNAAMMRASAMRQAQRTFGNRAMQEALAPRHTAARKIQRSCSCGGGCASCQAESVEPLELIQRKPVGAGGGEVDASVIPDTPGQPLDGTSQQLLQAGVGADVSGVRVHTDARAADSAAALQADAYTVGRDIYFGAGKYSPGNTEGDRLIAHEVTHTLQQSAGEAPTAPARHGSVLVGDVDDPMEREAEQVADAVVHRSAAPDGAVTEDREPAIRRDFSLSGAWDATGGAAWRGVKSGAGVAWGAAKEVAGDLWDAAKETAAVFIDTIAPGLLPFLRDVGGALFDKITSGLGGLMNGLSERIRNQGVAGAIAGIFADLASSLGKAIGQLATGSCQSMIAAAESVIDFVKEIGGEEIAELGKVAKAVGGFFSQVWDDLGAPALDAIQKAAGAAWTWIKEKAAWVWDLLLPVRKASATAWDWIKRQFNIAKEEGAGILDWIYDKAKEQWFKIRDKIAPILGPLKVVAAALILLSPLGPIILIWKGAPVLWNALKWIWANGIKPAGEKLRNEFRDHILPLILSGVDQVTAVLDQASAFLCEHASAISTGLQSLQDALAGIPFLGLASRAVGVAVTFFGNLAGKGKCKFSDVVGEVKGVLRKIYEFVKPVLEILRQAALIAVLGPLAILDDGVWNTLNQFVAFAKKVPCVREIAGLVNVDGAMRVVGEIRANLKDIWEVVSNQDRFEAEIHKALDGLLALIPGKVEELGGAIVNLDGPHLHILLSQFLIPKIASVAGHWKDMLIGVVWDIVWPWPGVLKDAAEAEKHAGKLKTDLWDFEFSKAADDGLAVWRDVNGIVGHLYGWFFLAAVLIGAIFGAPEAGAAVAYEVGEVLLASTLLAEGLTIEKSRLNLMSDARLAMTGKEREAADHDDYESLSGSIVNLAILEVMSVLGELAVDFAKAVFSEIKGIFLPETKEAPAPEVRPAADAPKPDSPQPDAKPADAPKPDAPKPDAPKAADAPQPEAPKPEAKPADAPKPDAPKPDAPKAADAPQPEAPKPEAKPADAPKPDAPKQDAPKAADAPQPEAPKPEAKPADAPKPDAPKPADAPQTEAPKPEAKPADAPKPDAPKPADAPQPEAPKPEAKPADAPKPDAPKAADAPQPEAPKPEAKPADAPKPDAPKAADAPQPEAPKPEAKPADAPKPDAPKAADAPQPEVPQPEAKPADAPGTDAPKPDAPKPSDAPQPEAPNPESPGPEDPAARKGWPEGVDKAKVNDVLDGRRPLSDLTPEEAGIAADYYDEVASQIKDNPGSEGSKSTPADRRAFNRERARYLREGTGQPPRKLFDFLKDHDTGLPETPSNPPGDTPAPKPDADPTPGPNEPQSCFVAGTLVHTPAGPRPIEALRVGDAVLCADPGAPEKRACEVVATLHRAVPAVLRLDVGGATIRCSPEHPFWVPASGWRAAGELSTNSSLLSLDRGVVPVVSIAEEAGPVEVFNLTVDGPHTFLVSPLAILVHNKAAARGPLSKRVQGLKSRAGEALSQAEALPPETPGRGEFLDRAKSLGDQVDRLAKDTESATPAEREQILEPDFTDHETELGDLEDEMEAARRNQLEDKLQDLQEKRADLEDRKADFEKEAARQDAKAQDLWDQSYQKQGAERNALQERARRASRQAEIARQKARSVRGDLDDVYGGLKRTELQLHPEERSVLPCFAAGTPVWSASGPRSIDSLAPGDSVLAFDFALGRAVPRQVIAVYRNRAALFYHVQVADTVILATGLHRFWVEPLQRWVASRDLQPGMQLRLVSGSTAAIQTIEARDAAGAATWNLQIEEFPNYFVGPGTLVHNANPARYDFGNLRIYRGTNPDPRFAERVYIGQTDDLGRRQGEHRAIAEARLKDPSLTPEQREFYEFMKGVELDEVVSGLNKPQADYLEQTNIDIETNVSGGDNVMNRREQVGKKNLPELEDRIRKDPQVQEQGFCK